MYKFLSLISVWILGMILMVIKTTDNNSPDADDRSTVDTVTALPDVSCTLPVTYRIGSIDSRYDITRQELKEVLRDVETLWESAVTRDLMKYKSSGRVAVQLVYGKNQEMTEQEKRLSAQIEKIRNRISGMKSRYERLADEYRQQQDELQSMIAHYKQVVKKYKRFINDLKQNGGIPRSKKTEVNRWQRRIKHLESEVQKKEQKVESARKQANSKQDQINELAARQNQLVSDYNRKFAEAEKFNQGNYAKKGGRERIRIFQFGNRGELTAVLAHEFGHAMGIGHVDNPKSIMHAVMSKQNIYDLHPTPEDIDALRKACEW